MRFECARRIRFAHCDPAGIVFYPRYAELLNEVVEDWFADGIGIGFPRLLEEYRLGVPVVQLACDFLVPARLGETLKFGLHVSELGNSSLQLEIEAARGEHVCMRARLKLVMISMESFRAMPLDDFWRSRFVPYLPSP